MRKSIILKTLIASGNVSLAVLDTTAAVGEGVRRHGLSPVAAAAFGRTLTAGAYLCSWLKEEESSLSVTVAGGGAGGKINVAGDGNLFMRGFVENGEVSLPPRADGKLDVGGFVGRCGTLTVIRDDGSGVPFVGTSELVTGEIAEDLSAYFLKSEQRPTAVALGVRVGAEGVLGAGGVFLQPLPGAGEEAVAFCEREIGRFASVSSLIEEKGAEGVLRMLTDGAYDAREIFFRCSCSKHKAESAVLSLGKKGAEQLLEELGEIDVHCHYCNTHYTFTREAVSRLFREGS